MEVISYSDSSYSIFTVIYYGYTGMVTGISVHSEVGEDFYHLLDFMSTK